MMFQDVHGLIDDCLYDSHIVFGISIFRSATLYQAGIMKGVLM
jgi:hypothetical protein